MGVAGRGCAGCNRLVTSVGELTLGQGDSGQRSKPAGGVN